LSAHYYELSPTFRADNGFEPQNDQRVGSMEAGYTKHYDKSPFLDYISASGEADRKWNFDGVKKDEWVDANLQVQSRLAQTGMHLQYMASDELFHGVKFNGIWATHACFNTKLSGALGLSGNVNYGHRIARYELVMGKQLDYGLTASVKPIDRLLFSATYNHTRSDDVNTGERLFSQSVFWSRLSLQISRELSMRFVSQYNDRWRTWDLDPLITYRINSLTMFYVGSTHNYQDFDPTGDGPQAWRLTDRQFFMKLQYLFRV
jgi:hypothetical protein